MFNCFNLPEGMRDVLILIYSESKKHDSSLTEDGFIQVIFSQWLEMYLKNNGQANRQSKNNATLQNNLKAAIKASGKTQQDVSKEIGLNNTYLSQLIHGKYDPTITVVLLLMQALNYPPAKLNNLFYLKPVP